MTNQLPFMLDRRSTGRGDVMTIRTTAGTFTVTTEQALLRLLVALATLDAFRSAA